MSPVKGFVALALTLGLAATAFAAPNFLGPTGLLLTPTADALQEDAYNVSLFHFDDADAEEYAFNYGARPNLEVGFSRLPDEETIINAKYQFAQDTNRTPALALGVMDLTDQESVTLYGVASKAFSLGDLYGVDNFRAHLGIAGGDDNSGIGLNGLFGGLSFDVMKRATLMIEHDGDDFNFGGRYNFGQGFVAQVGVLGGDDQFVFGASYNGQF